MNHGMHLTCAECSATYEAMDVRYRCDCGGTLDVVHDTAAIEASDASFDTFDRRLMSREAIDRSGVWRFRELILPIDTDFLVAKPEGNTNLYASEALSRYTGVPWLRLKHEGENPTGSFKDRGMCAGVSMARALGMKRVACASTGNTSASMASYAAQAGMEAFVFIPKGGVSFGKIAQALAYGAVTIELEGDFDDAMRVVQEVCDHEGIYLLNSVNPFRIEGQKAIAFELLQDLGWQVPDWIVLPGGNLGNNSAIAKGLQELLALGWIDRLPRIGVVQASGANPLYTAFHTGDALAPIRAKTRATAIQIGSPVSATKSLRGLAATRGWVEQVTDQEILDAKAHVDAAGIGAEPASCATVAGLKRMRDAGIIADGERVCGVLTGHLLKDPGIVVDYHRGELEGIASSFANRTRTARADLDSVLAAMRGTGAG